MSNSRWPRRAARRPARMNGEEESNGRDTGEGGRKREGVEKGSVL